MPYRYLIFNYTWRFTFQKGCIKIYKAVQETNVGSFFPYIFMHIRRVCLVSFCRFISTNLQKIQTLPMIEAIHGVQKSNQQTMFLRSTYAIFSSTIVLSVHCCVLIRKPYIHVPLKSNKSITMFFLAKFQSHIHFLSFYLSTEWKAKTSIDTYDLWTLYTSILILSSRLKNIIHWRYNYTIYKYVVLGRDSS